MPVPKKPLWTCPHCGHRFVTPNMWHSCTRLPLDHHFESKVPGIRKLFNKWLAFAKKHGGPVMVISQKTRITFMVRVRFAGAVIRQGSVEGNVWLKRKVEAACFDRVLAIPLRNYVYYFKLTDPAQLNDELAGYVRESCAIGCQQELSEKANDLSDGDSRTTSNTRRRLPTRPDRR